MKTIALAFSRPEPIISPTLTRSNNAMARNLSAQQAKYVDGVMKGKSRNASAIAAGYPHAQAPEKSALVKAEIQLAREKLTDLTQISRLDVVEGIMDSIAMARMQSDPNGVRLGWMEVGKILGHYAPEVKVVKLTDNMERLNNKLASLSTEELMKIVDAEVTDVTPKDPK